MPKGKKKAAATPQKGELTQGDRGGAGSPGGSSSFPQPNTKGCTGASSPLDQMGKLQGMEVRMGKLETGFQMMASLLGGVQASLERLEASSGVSAGASQARKSHKRQSSPPWLCCRSSSSDSSSDSCPPPRAPKVKKEKSHMIMRILSLKVPKLMA